MGMKTSQSIPTPSLVPSEWVRLPRPRERCPLTGLSRTSLVELLDLKDTQSGEYLIKQYTKKRFGKQRGIRMIHRASLLAFLDQRAAEQCQRHFGDWVNNPKHWSVEDVVDDFELWSLFVDSEAEVSESKWQQYTPEERIHILDLLGLLGKE
jgi:hypothetical protein